ncbi:hypothetical protein DRJ22_05700, partial [Candidatus Woesearchaeota archaeon]
MGDTTKFFSRERELLLERKEFLSSFLPGWVFDFEYSVGSFVGVKSDVKGFTSLTERLTGLGDEGVDLLAEKISEVYSCFDFFDGIEYHEGDAVIALSDDVVKSVRAGFRAQELIENLDPVFGNKLRMRLGLDYGVFFRAVVGTDYRRIPVIAGPGLKKAYLAEELSVPGQVCLSEECAGLFKEVVSSEGLDFKLSRSDSGLFVVDSLEKRSGVSTREFVLFSDSDKFSNEDLKEQIKFLESFFPEYVLNNLEGKGGFRTPSILFASFPQLKKFTKDNVGDASALFEAYSVFAGVVVPAVEGRGGVVDKFYDGKLIAYDLSESSSLHLLEASHEIL